VFIKVVRIVKIKIADFAIFVVIDMLKVLSKIQNKIQLSIQINYA